MPLIRIAPKPGINSQLSPVANGNGYSFGNLIRHRQGLIEKLAGWLRLVLAGNDVCAGFIRVMHAWLDLSTNKDLLIGTDGGPQLIVNNTLYTLTIIGRSATTTGGPSACSFSVTIGSQTVSVAVPSDFLVAAGETFTLQMPVSIGGRILASGSTFTIVTAAVSVFTFTMPLVATYTELGTRGVPFFGVNPASQIVAVQFRAHGLSPGNFFTIQKTTTISQSPNPDFFPIYPGTTYLVNTVLSADVFTFINFTPYVGPFAAFATEGEDQSLGTFPILFSVTLPPAAPVSPLSQSWFSDNLGQNGLMLYSGSPLFVFIPPVSSGAYLQTVGFSSVPVTAPQISQGMFVAMPQAQVILFGTEVTIGGGVIDPLLLRFSDVGTYDVWTATVSNQAGSYRLSRGSKIVGGIQAPQTTLLFTDLDVWSMSYIGPPLVYGFAIMGSNCGLAAPRAIACLGRNTFWQGADAFWMFSDGGARTMDCPVWDYIFRDLDTDNIQKCHAGSISATNEIFFFFPSLTDKASIGTNLLSYSQDFSKTTIWAEVSLSSITGGFADPGGGLSAQRIVEDSLLSIHYLAQTLPKATQSIQYTASVYCHKNSTRGLMLYCPGGAGSSVLVIYDVTTGTFLGQQTAGTGFTLISTAATTDSLATGIAGNGWLRYSLVFTTDATALVSFLVINYNTGSATQLYVGDGTSGVIAWGAQLNLGTLLPYQATTLNTGNECTRYVKYNQAENLWDTGVWPFGDLRTAWLDYNIFGQPLGGDSAFRIQQHEQGYDDDTDPMTGAFVESGYGAMSDGNTIMSIDQVQPDFKWFGNNGSVNVTLKSLQYPGGPQQSYGPYPMTPTTQYFSTRVRAKLIATRYEWAPVSGFSARLGATAFRVKPAGTRP